MKILTEYPTGAIKFINQVNEGDDVYLVWALGKNSKVELNKITSDYNDGFWTTDLHTTIGISALDFNISQNAYNDHYVFKGYQDAMFYFERCLDENIDCRKVIIGSYSESFPNSVSL